MHREMLFGAGQDERQVPGQESGSFTTIKISTNNNKK